LNTKQEMESARQSAPPHNPKNEPIIPESVTTKNCKRNGSVV
jgi:hypothetical protein